MEGAWRGGGLDKEEVERYARQLVLPSFGVANQRKLKESSVLVVGAGGLGSPVCLYLAAAGVGRIGVVDHDHVEKSNLHRQVLHAEVRPKPSIGRARTLSLSLNTCSRARRRNRPNPPSSRLPLIPVLFSLSLSLVHQDQVGTHKAVSASISMHRLNSTTTVETHVDGFRPKAALKLVEGYDVVVDASDNPATRYCVNDACVIAKRPLVSGAAIGTDGQLSVYNHGEGGPCYRCVWPDPPASGSCQRCSDHGVLGVLPGIIGTLQALETIKVITGIGECTSGKLLMFDGLCTGFRTLKLRGRQASCAACGPEATITRDTIAAYDYEAKCGGPMHDRGEGACLKVLGKDRRVSCSRLSERMEEAVGRGGDRDFVLLDVRPRPEFDFAHLPGSVTLPMEDLEEAASGGEGAGLGAYVDNGKDVLVVCRRGNDSQVAVRRLEEAGVANAFDVEGGLQSWSKTVDPTFPLY